MAKTMLEAAGGLALFLFGIALMTGGLRDWTSERLPRLLRRATAGRGRGLVVGTMLGALVQRSAGTMLTVGFVHAGLMTLAQSLPLLLGLNIGTTLAIQLIAFRVTDYAGLPLAVGALLFLTGGGTRRRSLGVVLLGLGIIFFGLATMSAPMRPHHEALGRWLSRFDGATASGFAAGALAALAITAIIQSSCAVIGLVLALVSAGVIVRFEQAYPLLIGAHIGPCFSALLGCLGARREAKRVAAAQLLFNLFGGAVG